MWRADALFRAVGINPRTAQDTGSPRKSFDNFGGMMSFQPARAPQSFCRGCWTVCAWDYFCYALPFLGLCYPLLSSSYAIAAANIFSQHCGGDLPSFVVLSTYTPLGEGGAF